MPASVRYIAEEHFVFVEWALAHLALCVVRRRDAVRIVAGRYRCGWSRYELCTRGCG